MYWNADYTDDTDKIMIEEKVYNLKGRSGLSA